VKIARKRHKIAKSEADDAKLLVLARAGKLPVRNPVSSQSSAASRITVKIKK
jgi:hypothetical protein